MSRLEKIIYEIEKLQDELDKASTSLIRVDGKPVKYVLKTQIGRGRFKQPGKYYPVKEQQESVPVILVKDA